MKDETKRRLEVQTNMTPDEFEERLKKSESALRLLQALDETTPILITKLIANFREMTDDEIYEALAEIRTAAEIDAETKAEYKKELDMIDILK